MAIVDINFNEGEGQDFIIEKAFGSLNAAVDVLSEPGGSQHFIFEIPQPTGGGGGNIFIMSE